MNSYITVTRFNESTWREHSLYRNTNNKLVYNSPSRITDCIPVDSYIFVLEMHNDENKIKGIGIIKNHVLPKKCKIFEDQNYNRFAYKCLLRIDREDLNHYDESIVTFFDIMCFKGKKHLKRGKGIQRIPNNIIESCKSILYFPKYFETLFENRNKSLFI
tara:strand:+ start:1531 stop:2010 length:480 start_codon:yes stop_codon:yes gene_type:complete